VVRWPARLFLSSLLLFLGAIAFSRGTDQSAAHTGDLGFIWFSNTTSNMGVDDHTNCCYYWDVISAAVPDWNNLTILNPVLQNHSAARIHVYNYNYGSNGWFGAVFVWSGNTLCGSPEGPTNDCNKTTVKADTGYVLLNDYYLVNTWNPNWYSAAYAKRRTTAHELGHIFGLSHAACSNASLMSPTNCWHPSQPPNNSITSHDVSHVNLLY
jgi:predicted Zn-dependent protease